MRMPTSTRFYQVRPPNSTLWARIWITDDGCISILSDHGNYGYWFGQPGCEFRKFLCECDDDYLGKKFSGGRREFDLEDSVKHIRYMIRTWRRDGSIDKTTAAQEWELARDLDAVNITPEQWYFQTGFSDASEMLLYRVPIQLQMFLKHLWPLFIEQLRAELVSEISRAGWL